MLAVSTAGGLPMRFVLAVLAALVTAAAAHAQTVLERGHHSEIYVVAVSPTSTKWHLSRIPVSGNPARATATAESAAVRICGAGCTVLLRFGPEPACMVLARGTPGWGGAYAATPEAARAQALADCRTRNQSCRIQTAAYCYR
jgi:hypothetical protein